MTFAGHLVNEELVLQVLQSVSSATDLGGPEVNLVNSVKDLVYNSFLKVLIFPESRQTTVVKESPQFTDEGLLTALGGAFSLYLGFSILSLFEVVEIVYRMFRKMTWGTGLVKQKEGKKLSL